MVDLLSLFKKSEQKPGTAPGTIEFIGEQKIAEPKIRLFRYDAEQLEEKEIQTINECLDYKDKTGVKWINLAGIHKIDFLSTLGEGFGIHPLVLEDIANTQQQPKMEDYDKFLFFVLKMFHVDEKNDIKIEQLSIICGQNLVISFLEQERNVFDPVVKRIKEGRKTLRKSGADYLTYALLDAVVDNYFVVLRDIGNKVDQLKKEISQNPKSFHLDSLHKLQDEMLVFQNSLMPLQTILPYIEREESDLVSDSTLVYFRDVHDHLNQIITFSDAIREKLSSLNDFYLSAISFKTNEVMKTLALVATICVPITVIAGVYGMNFQHMPELSSPYAYPVVLAAMAAVGSSLAVYFKKKKWV